MAGKKRNKTDYAKIERDLVALERRLQAELLERLDNARNTSLDDPSELLDRAAEGEIDFMSAVSAEADSLAIDQIQSALRKLREGSYGVCDGCRKAIRQRRLKARPFAVLCIHCKEREERLGYVPAAPAVSVHGGAGVTVSLTDEDFQAPEGSAQEALREIQDMEISGLY